jgi:glycerophosphoryl diester phosphodiesterase
MNLHRAGRPLVIGHRGAAALAPENTLAALAAAVDAGADLVEFDVGEGLLLGHSAEERPDDPVSLDDALAFLAARGVGAHVDLKQPGIEQAVVDAVRRHGLGERALISTAIAKSVRRVAAIAPDLPRAIGYPYDRHGAVGVPWPRPVTATAAGALRAVMPLRLPLLLRTTHATVVALHRALVSRAVVTSAHARGVPVLAWTVNDAALVERLVADGVDGIVTDDPGLVSATLGTLHAR